MKFRRYLNDAHLNNANIAVYDKKDGSVILRLERNGRKINRSREMVFSNNESFKIWEETNLGEETPGFQSGQSICTMIDMFI